MGFSEVTLTTPCVDQKEWRTDRRKLLVRLRHFKQKYSVTTRHTEMALVWFPYPLLYRPNDLSVKLFVIQKLLHTVYVTLRSTCVLLILLLFDTATSSLYP